jgi:hypothetical protein
MPSETANPLDNYWCAKSGLDLAAAAQKRVDKFYNDLPNTVMWRRWTKAYKTVYGLSGIGDPFDVSRANVTGDDGELVALKVNHAGSLNKRAVGLVSQTVPEFEPIPANTDSKSLEQVDFTKNLLNYYMDTKGVGGKLYDTALAASIFGIAWLSPGWDPWAGGKLKAIDPLMPMKKRTGDLSFKVYDPLDVVLNRFRYDQDHDWYITRDWVNRYTLAARYPSLAQQIVDFRAPSRSNAATNTNAIETERARKSDDADELVPLWTLHHRKTEAIEEGKIAHFLSADILLYEGNQPYDQPPMIPVCPGKFLRTPHGDTSLHHILGLQDIYDNVLSSISTNVVAFGTQLVMVPDDADFDYKEVAKGLAILRYTSGPDGKSKPEGLNLTAPNEQALRFADLVRSEMETISGISATLRGAPQANVDSGAFGALIAQQALEYQGAFQYSFQQAVAGTGQAIVSILKQYASAPIVAEIAGKSKAYELRSFTRADLDQIERVIVKSGNPAARTAQFAIATADSLLAKGMIDKREYLTLVRTGTVETAIDSAEAKAMNLRRENEFIMAGKCPPVVITDQHREHIDSHGDQIADPGAREDAKVQAAGLEHIQMHIDALRTTDPALLMLLGQTPLGPAPGMSPGPQGTPPAPEGPPGVEGAQPGPDPAPPPPQAGGQLPQQPSMPTNPMTGQEWSPADGSIQASGT